MDDLIIHPRARALLEAYLRRPTHALLLTGATGVGLDTIAEALARAVSGATTIALWPDDKGLISVETIRDLYNHVRAKRTSPLTIVVHGADSMSRSAPEAFLKLLEEPTGGVHYILTSHTTGKLPSTILSRLQIISVDTPDPTEVASLMNDVKLSPLKRSQLTFMAADLPAELCRLLQDEAYFRSLARNYEAAKQFLHGQTYERLQIISSVKKRPEAQALVQAISRLVRYMAERSGPLTTRAQAELLSNVADNLAANGNVRAELTYLATNMVQ
jgi:hypothetical protein